jgi:hypothetical protein
MRKPSAMVGALLFEAGSHQFFNQNAPICELLAG